MKSGNSSSPIFQEKHSDESNARQVPSCADHDSQESGKSKAEVPGMRASKSLGVMDETYDQSCRNKNLNLEHGSEIINLCLTANLLDKVHDSFLQSKDRIWLQENSFKSSYLPFFDIVVYLFFWLKNFVLYCDMS